MIDHLGIAVSNTGPGKQFHTEALAPSEPASSQRQSILDAGGGT